MTAPPKIERCPFCGGPCEVVTPFDGEWYVTCQDETGCGYMSPRAASNADEIRAMLAAHNKVAVAVRLFPAALDLARDLEWAGSCDLEDGGVAEACPVCGVEAVEPHLDGCQLHALLAEAQGVADGE